MERKAKSLFVMLQLVGHSHGKLYKVKIQPGGQVIGVEGGSETHESQQLLEPVISVDGSNSKLYEVKIQQGGQVIGVEGGRWRRWLLIGVRSELNSQEMEWGLGQHSLESWLEITVRVWTLEKERGFRGLGAEAQFLLQVIEHNVSCRQRFRFPSGVLGL